MDLILWRHAEAEDGFPDAARALTDRGRLQATQMAAWLNARLPRDAEVLASPATRTQQTVTALGRPFKTLAPLGVDAVVHDILSAVDWPRGNNRTVLVVGHQPTLGELAARLLSGREAAWGIDKGALWWLRTDGARAALIAALTPELL